jgi:hypothetical protein
MSFTRQKRGELQFLLDNLLLNFAPVPNIWGLQCGCKESRIAMYFFPPTVRRLRVCTETVFPYLEWIPQLYYERVVHFCEYLLLRFHILRMVLFQNLILPHDFHRIYLQSASLSRLKHFAKRALANDDPHWTRQMMQGRLDEEKSTETCWDGGDGIWGTRWKECRLCRAWVGALRKGCSQRGNHLVFLLKLPNKLQEEEINSQASKEAEQQEDGTVPRWRRDAVSQASKSTRTRQE